MNRDREWVEDIQEALLLIESYLSPDLPAFLVDRKTQDAVIRQFAVIGEATKRLSQTVRERYDNIPWRKVAGLRDLVIHDYDGIDARILWKITQEDFSELKKTIQQMLDDLAESPSRET